MQAEPEGGERPSKKRSIYSPSPVTDSLQDITEIARKLAAHGGGSASLELAFDLVLHEIVQQARAASGATGAAVALTRDGKMVCRATSGENAPDLGVSVEAASGLTGTCLQTGTVQYSRDTESDPGVDPETCRQLGVRSMLLIPLIDANRPFGVLQLFSSSPNAFGDQEMSILLRLADRVAESRRAMSQSLIAAPKPADVDLSMRDQLKPMWSDHEPRPDDFVLQPDWSIDRKNEIWTTVLFFLVIIVAISLGIVVGWTHGGKAATTPSVPQQSNPVSVEKTQPATKLSDQVAGDDATSGVASSSNSYNKAKSVTVPVGGVVVTENGKVIYRSPEEPRQQSGSTSGGRELIHRVEPDYPSIARAQHVEGTVVLDIEIARDGSVANTAVISGNPLLATAAIQAVEQWQYRPDPGGDSRTRVTLQFTLPAN